MCVEESWCDEQLRAGGWRFRLRYRWESLKMTMNLWRAWLHDDLVWDLSTMTEDSGPLLMTARTKRHLPPDDPRHFEDWETE